MWVTDRSKIIYGGYPIIKRKLSEGDIITCMDMHVNPITGGILFSPEKTVEEVSHVMKTSF